MSLGRRAERAVDGPTTQAEVHRRSLEDPEAFWGEAAKAIDCSGGRPGTTGRTAAGRRRAPRSGACSHLLQRGRPPRRRRPRRAAGAGVRQPGYDLRIVDEAGVEVAPGTQGNIAVKLPLPPGCLATLWQDDDSFVGSYLSHLPGHYTTGDGGYFEDDYLFVMDASTT